MKLEAKDLDCYFYPCEYFDSVGGGVVKYYIKKSLQPFITCLDNVTCK